MLPFEWINSNSNMYNFKTYLTPMWIIAAVHHLLIGSAKGIIPLYFNKSMRENPSIFAIPSMPQ